MRDELTEKQSQVLDFIAQHIVTKQRPPTRMELRENFGWSSVNSAEEYVQALCRKGFVALEGSGSQWQRHIRVIRWPSAVRPILKLAA